MKTPLRSFATVFIPVVFYSCSLASEQSVDPLKEAGILVETKFAIAKEFTEKFASAEKTVFHYNFNDGSQSWRGSALLHGRFIISIAIPITITKNDNNLPIAVDQAPGDMVMQVREVVEINKNKREVRYGRQTNLSPEQWNEIVHRKSLTVIWKNVDELPPLKDQEMLVEWLGGL